MNTAATLKAVATGKGAVTTTEKPKDLAHLMASPAVLAQIKAALPRHMTPERMARIATTELRKNPKLAQCEPMSFLGAVIQCAQIGLEPGNALGHAYILPYDKRGKVGGQWQVVATEAQLIIGYRGMIDLARRSGQILSLSATAVYEGDEFECVMGLEPSLRHVPDFDNPDRENPDRLTFVYAVAKLKDGGTQFAVMSRAQINAIRERSQGYTTAKKKVDEGKKPDNPWFSDYEAMALKTVIRRLFKYLPVSVEIQRAVQLDEKADAGLSQDNAFVIDGMVREAPSEDEGAPAFTYEQLAERVRAATSRDEADQAVADSEALAAEDRTALRELVDELFPQQ
jgi:recombination protein RecT